MKNTFVDFRKFSFTSSRWVNFLNSHSKSFASCFAILSQSSFSACPAWPFSQLAFTLWTLKSSLNSIHNSLFFTGFFSEFSQRFFCHFSSHSLMPFTTYELSVKSCTSQGSFNAFKAFITAFSSIWLFVVFAWAPLAFFSCSLKRKIYAQPPFPGFPRQEPSQKICIFFTCLPYHVKFLCFLLKLHELQCLLFLDILDSERKTADILAYNLCIYN